MGEQYHLFDLHFHTRFSDGQHDVDEFMPKLIDLGIEIVGFADHIFPGVRCFSKSYLEYRKKAIRYLDRKWKKIRILNSGEIDMYIGGNLTLPRGITDEFFDYVLVAKHHTIPKPIDLFKKRPEIDRWNWKHNPRLRLNRRLWKTGVQSCFSRHKVDIFAHPYEGLPKYFTKEESRWTAAICKKYGVAIELNNVPLDIMEDLIISGADLGCEFSLASDFHGFGDGWEKHLWRSQESYDIAKEYGCKLIDPRKFLPKN